VRLDRAKDAGIVSSILTHPMVKPEIWDLDGDPVVPMHDSIYHLIARDERHADGAVNDVILGVVAFLPVNGITWNPHIAILPSYRGVGTQVMKLGMKWMAENTNCKKLVAYPPAFNARMIRVFEKCGFRLEGVSPNSFLWHGEKYARMLMGTEI
jgi:RimJ/RimL family protein N-acetyltransferase